MQKSVADGIRVGLSSRGGRQGRRPYRRCGLRQRGVPVSDKLSCSTSDIAGRLMTKTESTL